MTVRDEIERTLIHHLPARMLSGLNDPAQFTCACGYEETARSLETPWMMMARHQAAIINAVFEVLGGQESVRMHAVLDAAKALDDYREWGGRYGQTRRRMNNSTRIVGWLVGNAARLARREEPL